MGGWEGGRGATAGCRKAAWVEATTSLPSILRCYISQSSGYRNDRHRNQYQRGHLVGARPPSNTLPSTTTYLNLIVTISYKHNHKYKFYFHVVPIKHKFLLPTLKTQKRSIDAPQERRPGAAPQPHSRRSHWSGPPSALSPSHHTLQSSPQGRPSRPENTCETHSKGTNLNISKPIPSKAKSEANFSSKPQTWQKTAPHQHPCKKASYP